MTDKAYSAKRRGHAPRRLNALECVRRPIKPHRREVLALSSRYPGRLLANTDSPGSQTRTVPAEVNDLVASPQRQVKQCAAPASRKKFLLQETPTTKPPKHRPKVVTVTVSFWFKHGSN